MIRILICDDHGVVRRGLKEILEEDARFVVRGEACSANEMLKLLEEAKYDLLIMDLTMPGKNGLEALKEVKKAYPKLPVLILSVHDEDQYALRALKAGASGYMTKELAPSELLVAVAKVLAGQHYLTPRMAEKLVERLQYGNETALHEDLSDREYQILCLIASGRTATQIAFQLKLSVKTVSTYRSRILEKMHLENNAELTHYALSRHLVDGLSD